MRPGEVAVEVGRYRQAGKFAGEIVINAGGVDQYEDHWECVG